MQHEKHAIEKHKPVEVPTTIKPLDWVTVESLMKGMNLGIEFGVSAVCRIQDLRGEVTLCYAKTQYGWRFCDKDRMTIDAQPVRIQQVAWEMLPDLLNTLNEEAIKLADQMRQAVAVLRETVRLIHERDEEAELGNMVGLS